jgi:hypothetical protein
MADDDIRRAAALEALLHADCAPREDVDALRVGWQRNHLRLVERAEAAEAEVKRLRQDELAIANDLASTTAGPYLLRGIEYAIKKLQESAGGTIAEWYDSVEKEELRAERAEAALADSVPAEALRKVLDRFADEVLYGIANSFRADVASLLPNALAKEGT